MDDEKIKEQETEIETADVGSTALVTVETTYSNNGTTWQERHNSKETEREDIRARHNKIREYDGVVYRDADPTPSVWDDGEKSVAVYTRVSTMGLSQTSSIENQGLYYTDKVNKTENWELSEIYSDEGKSGTSTRHREAFRRMMQDAKLGKFDMIICASVSRFARNVSDCMDYVANLRTMNPKHPIGVYFETENIFTLSPDADQTLGFHALLADWESGNKSRRMILSYDQRIFTNQFPVSDLLGLRHTKDGDLVVVPEEAKTVRFIFLSYLAGTSLDEIAEILTEKQRPTLKGRTDWNAEMVRNIMTNERRWGDLDARKTIVLDYKKRKIAKNTGQRKSAYVPNHHEAIVSRDIAMAARMLSHSYGLDSIPEMYVIEQGALKGFISICPSWDGIDDEALRAACKSVYTEDEIKQLDIEEAIRFGEEPIKVYSMTFSGYQVPHSGFFVKSTLPTLTLANKGITFNVACHRRLDNCRNVEFLYHPVLQTIVVRPCDENCSNAISWETDTGKIRNSMTAPAFCNAIFERMNWVDDYRFKFRGISRERGDSKILIFELDEPQILVGKRKKTTVNCDSDCEAETRYIQCHKEETHQSKITDDRAFIAYPAELGNGFGISYALKQRLKDITHNITENDMKETGTVTDGGLGDVPTKQEMLVEIDSILESM